MTFYNVLLDSQVLWPPTSFANHNMFSKRWCLGEIKHLRGATLAPLAAWGPPVASNQTWLSRRPTEKRLLQVCRYLRRSAALLPKKSPDFFNTFGGRFEAHVAESLEHVTCYCTIILAVQHLLLWNDITTSFCWSEVKLVPGLRELPSLFAAQTPWLLVPSLSCRCFGAVELAESSHETQGFDKLGIWETCKRVRTKFFMWEAIFLPTMTEPCKAI